METTSLNLYKIEQNLKIGDEVIFIKSLPNNELNNKTAKIVEFSAFRKPVLYIEIEGHKIACLPEHIMLKK